MSQLTWSGAYSIPDCALGVAFLFDLNSHPGDTHYAHFTDEETKSSVQESSWALLASKRRGR